MLERVAGNRLHHDVALVLERLRLAAERPASVPPGQECAP